MRRIRDLVKAGATIVGPPPLRSPSRQNYPQCDQDVRNLATEVWGAEAIQQRAAGSESSHLPHALGKGRVFWGEGLEAVLGGMGLGPDFQSATPLRFTHRAAGDTQMYFVTNPKDREVTTMAAFRLRGLAPEFWYPDSGRIEHPAVYDELGGAIHVPLHLGPHGSMFVVFRDKAASDRVITFTRDGEDGAGRPANDPAAANRHCRREREHVHPGSLGQTRR